MRYLWLSSLISLICEEISSSTKHKWSPYNMEKEIKEAIEAIKAGKTILYPTDTCWAIGCDATNSAAVKKLLSLKKVSANQPLIILLDDSKRINHYVTKVPDIAWDIIDYSEIPLTIIFPKGKNVAPELLGTDGSVAIRITKDPFCKKIIYKLERPIVATLSTSNPNTIEYSFRDINDETKKGVEYTVNLRKEEKTIKKLSRIMKLELDGEFKFLRN